MWYISPLLDPMYRQNSLNILLQKKNYTEQSHIGLKQHEGINNELLQVIIINQPFRNNFLC